MNPFENLPISDEEEDFTTTTAKGDPKQKKST